MTELAPVAVKVQVRTLLPPLEQAPVHTAERPLDADRVTDVPRANVAEPLLPVATLMPAGLDVIRSPLRPVAVTVTQVRLLNAKPHGDGYVKVA